MMSMISFNARVSDQPQRHFQPAYDDPPKLPADTERPKWPFLPDPFPVKSTHKILHNKNEFSIHDFVEKEILREIPTGREELRLKPIGRGEARKARKEKQPETEILLKRGNFSVSARAMTHFSFEI